jgi:hypothetical protein
MEGRRSVAEASHAVFLSYAIAGWQDAEAAQKIADALRAGGIEVFLDQSELRGGDGGGPGATPTVHGSLSQGSRASRQ